MNATTEPTVSPEFASQLEVTNHVIFPNFVVLSDIFKSSHCPSFLQCCPTLAD